jgi:hypothetical protein
MIGFIPVYTVVLLFGLKFATLVTYQDWAALVAWLPIDGLAEFVKSQVDPLVRFWWVLPVIAAITDYLEDICHLRYCRLYERGPEASDQSAPLTMFSFLMTLIKDASFLSAGFITILGAMAGTHAMFPQLADWRAKFAVIISGIGIAVVLLVIVAAVAGRIRGRRRHAIATPSQSRSLDRRGGVLDCDQPGGIRYRR